MKHPTSSALFGNSRTSFQPAGNSVRHDRHFTATANFQIGVSRGGMALNDDPPRDEIRNSKEY